MDKIREEFEKYKNKEKTISDKDVYDKISVELNVRNVNYSRSELESFISCYKSRDEEIKKAVQDEREACALELDQRIRICESELIQIFPNAEVLRICAEAIRARNNK